MPDNTSPTPYSDMGLYNHVFDEKADEKVLRQDVLLLTSLLEGIRDGQPSRSPADANLRVWRDISFLLATGSERDRFANQVVAVTGKIENTRIDTTIFTRNMSRHGPTVATSEEDNPYAIVSVEGRKPKEMLYFLLKYAAENEMIDTGVVSFDQHVEDTVSAFNLLSTVADGPTTDQQSLVLSSVTVLMLNRTRLKQSGRLANGRNLWGEHPIEIICQHYSSADRAPLPEGLTIRSRPNSYFTRLLEATPEQDRPIAASNTADHEDTMYSVSEINIRGWIAIMRTHLATLKDLLLPKEELLKPGDTLDVRLLFVVLESLNQLLDAGLFHKLLSFPLVTKLDEAYEQQQQAALSGGTAVLVHNADETETIDSDVLDFTPSDADGYNVVQYLKSLTVCYASTVAIGSALMTHQKRISAHRVDARHPSVSLDADYFDEFIKRFSEAVKSYDISDPQKQSIERTCNTIRDKKTRYARRAFSAAVHAESSLMQLISHASLAEGEASSKAQSLFSDVNEWRIGTSQKCCRCCQLFSEVISGDAPSQSIKLVLPGTHAMIFPWIAPAGAKSRILDVMRRHLLKTFFIHATKDDASLASTQTSPTSSVSGLTIGRFQNDLSTDQVDALCRFVENKE